MRILRATVLCVLLAGTCSGVVIHESITYKSSVRRISGRVVGTGNINPGVTVEVFDKPEVWADDSLSMNEKRKRQKEIASTVTDLTGNFDFRGVRKGAYEVQFSTGDGGWDVLSVLVNVNPSGSGDRLCVQIAPRGRELGVVRSNLSLVPACLVSALLRH